ncbi:MAG: UPF0223 family protein [Prevotella sp.]|nr:UPF0223 family protein [Staphylococcus sp.]MCM1350246.1 UPF0223 family protein [Prevotella sp.]
MKKENKKKTNETIDSTYEIDYDLFTVDEIIKIIEFYHTMTKYVNHKVSKDIIKTRYLEYKNIIHNLSLEKKYNERFYKSTGISIYEEMKQIL